MTTTNKNTLKANKFSNINRQQKPDNCIFAIQKLKTDKANPLEPSGQLPPSS